MPVDLGRAAEWYASVLSWPVIPLHTALEGGRCSCGLVDCGSVAKHPRTRHGAHEGTTDLKKIRAWWREWPDANIGVLTGAVSGVIVIDIDPRNGGNGTYTGLRKEHGRGDLGFVARTGGGGRHIFYDYVDEPVIYRPGAGIEVKSDNGYVVVAPSMHASGQRYKWQDKPSVNSVLGTAPGWALDGHTARNSSNGTKAPVDMKRVIRDGERDNELTRVAGRMRRIGMNETEIYAALSKHNQMYCEPPKPESDVRRIARSAMRWQPDVKASATEIDVEPIELPSRSDRLPKLNIPTLLKRTFQGQYLIDPLLPREGPAILTADSASYKTWVLLDFALSVGSGLSEWAGFKINDTPGRVLFFECELPESDVQRRVKLLINGSKGKYKAKGVDFISWRNGFEINTAAGFKQIASAVLEGDYKLVIGDSLSQFHVGNESDSMYMTQVMKQFQRIEALEAKKYNHPCLFLLTHHMRKISKDGSNAVSQRSRGATSIRANAGSFIGLIRQASTGWSRVIHDKSWYGVEAKSFLVKPVDNSHGVEIQTRTSEEADRVEKALPKVTKADAANMFLSMFLGKHDGREVTRSEMIEALTQHGIAQRTADTLIKSAEEAKEIEKMPRIGRQGEVKYRVL